MQFDTVIWDWNGTLLNDVQLCCDILNEMLLNHGYTPLANIREYKSIFGFPIQDYYRRAGFDFARHPYAMLAEIYMDEYRRRSMACPLQPNAAQVLCKLNKKGVKQIVLSASPWGLLIEQIKAQGILEYFDTVLGLDNIYAKSKIELGQEWITQNNAQGKLIMIGDSTHDYDTAIAIGATPLLYSRGHQTRCVLMGTGADVIDDLKELLLL